MLTRCAIWVRFQCILGFPLQKSLHAGLCCARLLGMLLECSGQGRLVQLLFALANGDVKANAEALKFIFCPFDQHGLLLSRVNSERARGANSNTKMCGPAFFREGVPKHLY